MIGQDGLRAVLAYPFRGEDREGKMLQPAPGGAVTPQLSSERFSPGERLPCPGIMPGHLAARFSETAVAAPPAPADTAELASRAREVQMNAASSCITSSPGSAVASSAVHSWVADSFTFVGSRGRGALLLRFYQLILIDEHYDSAVSQPGGVDSGQYVAILRSASRRQFR